MVSKISISHNEEIYVVLVDDDDYPLLSRHTWCILKGNSGRPYAYTHVYLGEGKRKALQMTHLIMGNKWNVDHRNNNPLDNRKENLRVSNKQQNAWNVAKMLIRGGKPTSSKYKGVCKVKCKKNPWKAMIKADYVLHHLGRFATEEEAGLAYNEAAKRLHGEWAWLNVIPSNYASPSDGKS